MDDSPRPVKRVRRETSASSSFTIDIPLHPTYHRGTYPPPGRIQLLPEHGENTAYIVQKFIYPNGRKLPETVQKRPFYVIGWRDPELREARVGVECMRAYTYVSPRQVEEFEYQDLLAREAAEEEKERQEAEEMAAKFALLEQQQAETTGAPKKRGRPGRPPKKMPADDDGGHHVPSLSTPQKNRLSFSADNMHDLQTEMEDRIRSQNNGLPLGEDEEDEDEDEMLQRVLLQQAERNNKAERLDSDFTITIPSRSAVRTQPASRGGRGPGRPPKNRLLGMPKTGVPLGGPNNPRSGIRPTRGTKQSGAERFSESARTSVESTAPPSLPESTVMTRPSFTKQSSMASVPGSSTSSASSLFGDLTKNKSNAPGVTLPKQKRESTTPIPLPSYIRATSKDAKPTSSIPSKTTSLTALPPLPQPREDEAVAREVTDVDAPDEWEVLRLEGVKVEENNGEKTRYFKVRWKGDWPPDQNPSWEPEDCIDRAMVKAFLKLRKEKKKDAASNSHGTLAASTGPVGAKTQGTLAGWLKPGGGSAPAPIDTI